MLEAMWGLEYVSSVNDGGYGIAVFETSRILGGDSSFTFVGSYEMKHGKVKAKIKCTNYRGTLQSIFGNLKEFNLALEGVPSQKEFIAEGYMLENPQMKIKIKLTRIAELP